MSKKIINKSKKNKKSAETDDSIDSSDSEGSQAMEVDVEDSDDENNNNAPDSDEDDMNFDIGISHENINSKNLEKIIENDAIISFNSSCVRKKSNWSKASNKYKFDNPQFSPEILLNDIPNNSPKLNVLLKKIEQLDKHDMKKHGKLFKHFVFSDLKSSTYGAKLLASALIAKGMKLGYTANLKKNTKNITDADVDTDADDDNSSVGSPKNTNGEIASKKTKKYGKIELLSVETLLETKFNNFYLLSSVSVYDQGISVTNKKNILKKFNQRPDNVNGELARIIIMDSGFKEGIDLFDVKYVHIFEPSTVQSDQKQVIGRSTRTCGQKGLEFHPRLGWPLYVFVYDLSIPDQIQNSFLGAKTTMELYLKTMNIDIRLFNFAHDLEKTTIVGSVDYELNKNIHSFSIPNEDAEEDLPEGTEFIYNGGFDNTYHNQSGGSNQHKRLVVRDIPPIVISSNISMNEPRRMNYQELKQNIREHFSDLSWESVKMENLCSDLQKGGSGEIIQYTPSQKFIRKYFTTANPCKGIMLFHSVGTGKCHAIDTPILMYDGTIKMVQDIEVGDKLMGDDSTPRTVLSLANGEDDMYDVIPIKGDKYTVNSEHILCLKPTRLGVKNLGEKQPNYPFVANYICNKTGKIKTKSFTTKEEANIFLDEIHTNDYIYEVSIIEFLKLSNGVKKNLKGYRTGVEFQNKQIDFDPYIIGFWLGDGSQRDPVISTQDSRILYYLFKEMPKYNLSVNYQSGYDYRISSSIPKGENKLLKTLQKYNLINNKHIPFDYKVNDRKNRLELLAGLIDSDGYADNKGYEITQKNKILAEDIVFLCRSLGYATYMKECEKSCTYKGEKKTGLYYRITINGDNLTEIPVKIERKKLQKRLQKKDVLVTGIKINHIGKGNYYGFTLDGNNRYLIGDFTVTHNTCSAIAAATNTFEREGYTILWVTRTTLKNDIWKNMFDQVCSGPIRNKITLSKLAIPDEQNKRMRLLSNSWRIRPMSYKQFSNLVSKQNAFYKTLVKINGEADPLRKTLLIIDEAHKLYGGGDLSTIERPDMNALHQAIMNSYELSGRDSVRLMLMTATPITEDPLELIKLINLMKPIREQMPTNFDDFSNIYLDNEGKFTENGRERYLNDIAGYISYLNREKDARQFAQPIIKSINTPIITDIEQAKRFDKKIVRDVMSSDINELKNQIIENNNKLKGELSEVNENMFSFLKKEVCNGLENKSLKQCETVVKHNIKQMVAEAKEEIKIIRDSIKQIRELVKQRNLARKESLSGVKQNTEQFVEDFDKYKNTVLYSLKNNCGIKITGNSKLKELVKQHPVIKSYDEEIELYNVKIQELQNKLKLDVLQYKKKLEKLKSLLKEDLSELERSVIKMTIRDERKTQRNLIKLKRKDNIVIEKELKESIRKTEKRRKKKYGNIRKTIKARIAEEKYNEKEIEMEEKELRQALRKQGKHKEDFKHELLNNLVDKYRGKIMDDLVDLDDELYAKQKEKEDKRIAKEVEKNRKKKERETRKLNKLIQKESAARERATRKAQKDLEKEQKKIAKLSIRKTKKQKNNDKNNK